MPDPKPNVMLARCARALHALPLHWRLSLFTVLERFSEWRNPPLRALASTDRFVDSRPRESGERAAVWLFISTIGELNAIEPFTRQLLAEMGDPPLVLVSDRDTYGDAYRAKYPKAQVLETGGRSTPMLRALRRQPPALLVIAEIPGLLHDAPCRLPFAVLHAARDAGARVVLVNGWLYGYHPVSGLDRIESFLFSDDYVRIFELALVQTEAVRQTLLARGAEPHRVKVSGNIKFDAWFDMGRARQTPLAQALATRAAMSGIPKLPGAVIVAGSVTEPADHAAMLHAFAVVLRAQPGALLVLAPRHPEDAPRMNALTELLDQSGLAWRRRSQHEPAAAVQGQVLVLDTMGELQGCYAAASLAFVGRDHNVLEPLAFGVPVFVGPGWEPTYPSYSVYRQLADDGCLTALTTLDDLGRLWCEQLADRPAAAQIAESLHLRLRQRAGAAARSIDALFEHALIDRRSEG